MPDTSSEKTTPATDEEIALEQDEPTAHHADERILFEVRAPFDDAELGALFDTAWPGGRSDTYDHIRRNALTWITARRHGALVGFVYVIGDGDAHTFLLSPVVHPDLRRHGLGRRLVQAATEAARASGAEWLHVDYVSELEPFYRSCGFRPTTAGLLRLRD